MALAKDWKGMTKALMRIRSWASARTVSVVLYILGKTPEPRAIRPPKRTPIETEKAMSFRLKSRTSASGFLAPSIWPIRMPTLTPREW